MSGSDRPPAIPDTSDIAVVPADDAHIEGFQRCLDVVARERRYILAVEGPALEQVRRFVLALREAGGVQFMALDRDGGVVGWCDIMRYDTEGFRHCGRLGMGLLPGARGRGVGRRLAEAAIEAAFSRGMERIELEVFGSNEAGIALYERLGFVREGVKRGARKLDGRTDDSVLMVLTREPDA